MIIVYTGEGKGKTSAAVGQCLRALGRGLRVAFGQFMKKPDQAGEQNMLSELLGPRFLASGAGFYTDRRDYEPHRRKALDLLAAIEGWLDQGLDMLILDEALYALGAELLTAEEMERILNRVAAEGTHLVLTGRGLPDWLERRADLVSEIKVVKHPFSQGRKPVPGIEF
jgi:cob(I)alamin adenosyltransferase